MAEPLPATYGPAGWINWTHNWRKEDGDFLQYRGILRYAADGDRPGSPQTGQTVYVQATDTVSVWSGEWIPLLSSKLLRLATSGTGSTGTATLSHISAGGAGLVFSNTKLRSSIDFITSQGFQADTVSIFTAAGGGNRTAKLTTSPANLISDSPILAPSLTLNGAAATDVLTLSAGNLKAGGSVTVTANLSAGGNMTADKFLMSVAQPAEINAAARKDYVDTQVGTRVAVAGDTMTGALAFTPRLAQLINLYGGGYGIGIQSSNLYFRSASAYKFYIGGSHTDTATASTLSIDSNSIDVTGGFTVTGTASITGALTAGSVTSVGSFAADTATLTASGAGLALRCRATANTPYIDFTEADGSPRYGYLQGLPAEMRLFSDNKLTFYSDGVERGRVAGSLMWGKTTGGTAQVGVELFESGTIYSTTATNVTPNMLLRHNTNAATAAYIQFANSTGGVICEIQQDTVAPTGLIITHATISGASDYRWKNELGPVTGALSRVMQLQPKRFRWKKGGAEFEGFAAHETESVVPYLVRGEKDAVTDTGEIDGQSFNYGGLSTLLAAAIQELTHRVTALEEAA